MRELGRGVGVGIHPEVYMTSTLHQPRTKRTRANHPEVLTERFHRLRAYPAVVELGWWWMGHPKVSMT